MMNEQWKNNLSFCFMGKHYYYYNDNHDDSTTATTITRSSRDGSSLVRKRKRQKATLDSFEIKNDGIMTTTSRFRNDTLLFVLLPFVRSATRMMNNNNKRNGSNNYFEITNPQRRTCLKKHVRDRSSRKTNTTRKQVCCTLLTKCSSFLDWKCSLLLLFVLILLLSTTTIIVNATSIVLNNNTNLRRTDTQQTFLKKVHDNSNDNSSTTTDTPSLFPQEGEETKPTTQNEQLQSSSSSTNNVHRHLRQQEEDHDAMSENDSKIFGGTQVSSKEKYSYMVGLFDSRGLYSMDRPVCGGVLIGADTILTAAHCVGTFDTVVLGLWDLQDFRLQRNSGLYEQYYVGSQFTYGDPPITSSTTARTGGTILDSLTNDNTAASPSTNIYVYPQFVRSTLRGDFAIVKLPTPTFNYQPISIVNTESTIPLPDTKLITMGWGYSNNLNDNSSLPNILLETEVTAISTDDCQSHYRKLNFDHLVSDTQTLCAYTEGRDACKGDSGGPLIIKSDDNDILVGLVSWGYGCDNGYPGAYARVSSIAEDWLSLFL